MALVSGVRFGVSSRGNENGFVGTPHRFMAASERDSFRGSRAALRTIWSRSEKSGTSIQPARGQKQRHDQACSTKHDDGFESFELNLSFRKPAKENPCDGSHLRSPKLGPRGEAGLAMVVQRARNTCEPSHTIEGKLRRNVYGMPSPGGDSGNGVRAGLAEREREQTRAQQHKASRR